MCGPNGCPETIRACDFCGGLGFVEVEAANRHPRDRALRNQRVHKRHRTQEQLARQLGISGRELNDIECGRADIPASVDRRLLKEL
jgi:hypothetical protein